MSPVSDPPTAIDPERLEKLVGLFHLKWTVPLLASLEANPVHGRVAVLALRLDVGRSTIHRTLRVLVDQGLVAPNPGYGHPLRPEYVLAPLGAELAPWCARFELALARRPAVVALAHQKWSMPLLVLVASGHRRFAELEAALGEVSPRALTQALRGLTAAGLLERSVTVESPVRVAYRVTRSGRGLAQVVAGFFEGSEGRGSLER